MIKTNNKLILRKSKMDLPCSMGSSSNEEPQPWNFKFLKEGYLSGIDLIYLGENLEFENPIEPFKYISKDFFNYEISDLIVSKNKIIFTQHPEFNGLITSVWEGWYPNKVLSFKSGRYKFVKGEPIAKVYEFFPTYFSELSEFELEIANKNKYSIEQIKPIREDNRYELSLMNPPIKKLKVINNV